MTQTKTTDAIEKLCSMIKGVEATLEGVEMDLRRAKITLNKLSNFNPQTTDIEQLVQEQQKGKNTHSEQQDSDNIVHGEFDGYFMVGSDQKKYPVPLNYASKTKLIPGDKLKLKIMNDGKLIYKLVAPAPRKHVRAVLSQEKDQKYVAITDQGTSFFLNQAAVTFFKGRPGDEVYIIINKEGKGSYAAIEAIIKA